MQRDLPAWAKLDVWLDNDTPSDSQWAALLHDPASQRLLEQMAEEALAEDDAGLTLDLDALFAVVEAAAKA